MCGVLVLTHNFGVWRPVVARLTMKLFVGCGYREGSGKIVSQNKLETSWSLVVSGLRLRVVVTEWAVAKL